MKLISPSLLSANFLNLEKDLSNINKSDADYLHLDIMDGVFVPNISYGTPVVEAVKKFSQKPLDVHLMIVNPEQYIDKFIDLGADILTIHLEATNHLHRAVWQIKNRGAKAGVSINPSTPVFLLKEIIKDVDLVLIMSVNPGFGGQKFIENTYKKIKELRKLIQESGSNAIIEVDGGVNSENYKKLFESGADMLVAGNFIFSSQDPIKTIEQMKK